MYIKSKDYKRLFYKKDEKIFICQNVYMNGGVKSNLKGGIQFSKVLPQQT